MSEYIKTDHKKVTTKTFLEMKRSGERISMLTAYDYTTAGILDRAGVDSILVGDSASNVMCGNSTTLPISIEEMMYYGRNVARACSHALVVCDMPFGTYQVSREEAVRNAVRMMQFTGADALKLEGGREILPHIQGILQAGIPVMGHLGLTPQSVHQFGGYGLRAKQDAEADKLMEDARMLAAAGCFAIVLEKIPARLAQDVTAEISCPTIGIGAGAHTDGQVLVYADALGLTEGFSPKFLRRFAQAGQVMSQGVQEFVAQVKNGGFPNEQESY